MAESALESSKLSRSLYKGFQQGDSDEEDEKSQESYAHSISIDNFDINFTINNTSMLGLSKNNISIKSPPQV